MYTQSERSLDSVVGSLLGLGLLWFPWSLVFGTPVKDGLLLFGK